MTVNAYAADTSILIAWGSTASAAVQRSADGGETWDVLTSAASGGRYADTDVTPGEHYIYKVTVGDDEFTTGETWVQPLWGWNTVTQVWAANDLVNRPTFRARILDATKRLPLSPDLVVSAELSVYSVLDNEVTMYPRYDRIAGPETLDRYDVCLPNLVADPVWKDGVGFNFRHTPDIDLEPGKYAFRYTLYTDDDPVLLSFLYDSSIRRRLNG